MVNSKYGKIIVSSIVLTKVLSFLAFAGWFHFGEPLFCGEYDKVLLKKNEHSFLFVILPLIT